MPIKIPVVTRADFEWRDHAACRGVDPETFLPEGKFERGSLEYERFVINAKQYCQHCPVVDKCFEYGLSQRVGIYGGKTVSERTKAKRLRNHSRIINVIMGER